MNDDIISNAPESALPQPFSPVIIDVPAKRPAFDRRDALTALGAFVLAWFFSRWVLFSWHGWGVTAFTAAYLVTGASYLRVKRGALKRASWFWFAVTLCIGVTYALWDNAGFSPLRALALFACATYWVAVAADFTVAGHSFLFFDGLNVLIIVPFRNFINQYLALAAFRKRERRAKNRAATILGAVFTLLLFLLVVPPLMRADGGAFSAIFGGIANAVADFFRFFNLITFLLYALPAIPVAAYMFGLLSGAAHDRHTRVFSAEELRKASSFRILPHNAVVIAMGALSGLYVLFIACQIPYYFSAFTNRLPENWLTYADYARQGFFELLRVAVTNVAVLLAATFLCKTTAAESRVLRILNAALPAVTLALLVAAFSKMALYVSVYGLTMMRLLPCVFMLFLAAVLVAVMVSQRRKFDVARFAVVLATVMFTALCAVNPDALVANYNASRFLNGTLETCDVETFRRAGAAGVSAAVRVYENTDDEFLRYKISEYIGTVNANLAVRETNEFNAESTSARTETARFIRQYGLVIDANGGRYYSTDYPVVD